MIILGLVLLVIGWFIHFALLEDLGVLLIIIGAILWIVPIGGRQHRYY